MYEIDVSLVAGRRPQTLEPTLQSFHDRFLRNVRIGRVIVNIDPIFGDEDDHARCTALVRRFFPDAAITAPAEANFCAAVRRNWAATRGSFVLHMEDDWLLRKHVGPEILAAFDNDAQLAQISFNAREKNWDQRRRGAFHVHSRPRRLFGMPLPLRRRMPKFTTSPSLLRGGFARSAAALMDSAYDPEKQFYNDVNMPLQAFVAGHRNLLWGDSDDCHVVDIGREWRERHGIEKRTTGAQSVWVEQQG